MSRLAKILVVDDEPRMGEFLATILAAEGYQVETTTAPQTALNKIKEQSYDVVITDLMMPQISGMDILDEVKKEDSATQVIMITGYSTVENAILAMKKGAFDYLPKPFKIEEIKVVVEKALAQRTLLWEKRSLEQELVKIKPAGGQLVGDSAAMQEVHRLIAKVAKVDSTVLIRGESGTGKELVAKAIHAASPRGKKPLISINCAAIPENLLESELFGHARGAFSGAVTAKKGLFEEADGSTIFLDEIGDISLALQAKLLRVLQEQEFLRIGETKPRRVDVRVISATNRNLEEAMARGEFRPDLYYRLNIITINLPPLRERVEDIPQLAQLFLRNFCIKFGKKIQDISQEALAILLNYEWPGNVRELENVLERAVILCEGQKIEATDLPAELQTFKKCASPAAKLPFKEAVAAFQKELIMSALEESSWVQAKAAELLGLKRTTLNEMLKRFNICQKNE
ncbi:sigma-54-dependent transcriptional regulator [Zhaonella formicivorans]|uniref:sigma-54-dependent transcriptional regulator n=1 Tax=Zhaonella formicivorans TaxID=2528593 RepID=UPI0010D1A2AC|nr:sigma-54 dependent transcriptional regulator [Zhaonella formicivorans]